MFPLNRFFDHSNVSVRSSPALPPTPQRTPGHFFGRFFEADSQDSRRSLSKQITRKTNIVASERIYAHFSLFFFFLFVACSATVASRDSSPVIQFKEKDRTVQVLNVAEVRRECVRRDVCLRGVSGEEY